MARIALRTACSDGIVQVVTALRSLRRGLGLTQREHATLLGVPLNSLRMWDSGLRPVPLTVLARTEAEVAQRSRQLEPLTLNRLAAEFDVHVQTLQDAVRSGRLKAIFSTRSVFGRPKRLSTRAAVSDFMAIHYYRRPRPGQISSPPLPEVPSDFDRRLRRLRRRLHLSQSALAERIGAASKAVVYQWESRKRVPSPVFWQRVQKLQIPTSRGRRGTRLPRAQINREGAQRPLAAAR
jgi:DNA-binding transcriptional regulator YiaG